MKPSDNDTPGELINAGEVSFERLLPGPIERVWQFLTDPEKRKLWFADGTAPTADGAKMQLIFRNAQLAAGEAVPVKYERHAADGISFNVKVLRCEPPGLLSHSWDEEDGTGSEVTFELSLLGDRVQLTLTHRRVEKLEDLLDYCGGWHVHFSVLVSELEGSPRPPFWATLDRLAPVYAETAAQFTPLPV